VSVRDSVLRRLTTTPAVRSLLARLRTPRTKPPVWSGSYPKFEDVPTSGPGYDGESWYEASRRTTLQIRSLYERGGAGAEQRSEHALLSLLVASEQTSVVRVMDFGGAMGATYVHVRYSAPHRKLDFHVVDNARMCEGGREILADCEDLRFHETLAGAPDDVDIANLSGVLQYVSSYRDLLVALAKKRPKKVLLANTNLGEMPTYATAQNNVAGSVLACWFFNANEIVEIFTANGYRLIFRALDTRYYDQSRFKVEERILHPSHLLFERAT
jgi:putative methyltransferase (TIGR04325 family)